ncbi:MAG: metallophosphoesterase [Bacteroidales bacterium]|nr:metallophosphoesterase [Bacteroidales bacterium]
MKFPKSVYPLFILLSLLLVSSGCKRKNEEKEVLKFAFLTDIHLNPKYNGCYDGLNMAIQSAKEHGAELVITGGDNAEVDVFKSDTLSARKVLGEFKEIINSSSIKINPTMGNHDRFWGIVSKEKPYGEALYEEIIGPSYYSFEKAGWKFLILNTIQTGEKGYFIDSIQMAWIRDELRIAGKEKPLIVSVHVPMMTVYSASARGQLRMDMFNNYNEVRSLFDEYNLKLVLQGHVHIHEEILSRGVQYVTGGAVSASWWEGPYFGTEEGYLLLSLTANDLSWEYIDYGWEARD